MVSVRGISFCYTANAFLFKNLSFDLEKGETLAVLGPNGAGKTTLLRCLMGFLGIQSGAVCVEGVSGGGSFWRQVGFVPQARQSAFAWTVLDMVMMGRTPYIGMGRAPSKEDRRIAGETLDRLGLGKFAGRSCTTLSGGELQMALIARALVKNPAILIMDEPESNLDMKNQLTVLNLVRHLSKERDLTIILNTHFPAHALRIADKVLLLGNDRHIYGDTDQVITGKNIAGFFGVHACLVDVAAQGGTLRSVIPTEIVEPQSLGTQRNIA